MTEICSTTPLSMRPFNFSGHDTNLTGRIVGHLTVRGVFVAPARARGLRRWACQCRCGNWVTRVTRALTNPANADLDACLKCRLDRTTRTRDALIAAGEYKPEWAETYQSRRGKSDQRPCQT